MKKYFTYLLKKNLLPALCLVLFCLIVYVLPLMCNGYFWDMHMHPYMPDLDYSYLLTALGAMAIFVPIYMFSYKMNKRSVDMYYSLPISRTKVLVVNFLVGLIMMYTAYTVAFLVGFLTIVIFGTRVDLQLVGCLYLYLASIIPAFIIYSITSFVFTRAKTTLDGVVSVAAVLLLFTVFAMMLNAILEPCKWYDDWLRYDFFSPLSPLIYVSDNLRVFLYGRASTMPNPDSFDPDVYLEIVNSQNAEMVYNIVVSSIWLVVAAAATVGLILTEKRVKAEEVGSLSESVFCYKGQIPAYMTFAIGWIVIDGGSILLPLILIPFCGFVAYMVYRRSVKIGWKNAITLGVSFALGVIIGLISLAASGRLW